MWAELKGWIYQTLDFLLLIHLVLFSVINLLDKKQHVNVLDYLSSYLALEHLKFLPLNNVVYLDSVDNKGSTFFTESG